MLSRLIEETSIELLEDIEELDMLEKLNAALCVDYDELYYLKEDVSPEKVLLSAVLERALMDLFLNDSDSSNMKYKKEAIRWFTSDKPHGEHSFVFKQVMAYLNISITTANKLVQLAKSISNKRGPYYDLYIMHRSWSNRSVRCSN